MSKNSESFADSTLKLFSSLAGIAFATWTTYRAVPMMWDWSIVAMGGPAITGMQAIVLKALAGVLKPTRAIELHDENGKKIPHSISVWLFPVGVWIVVGCLRLISWAISVPL